ncbi:leucine-rich repeat-containing protein 23 [Octopus bimaculoides]|uniref:U2A'/phosphoprotein 32 family A C-terminal domain-containing protein n=1 Tax=Octopus bimaculoides TaxID=37653 RepID=A0A0L8HUR9_OCTBM|nr:leucine-rich repeat-containing protein 23 [Octopus bimaculoides]|eukprot:XP_014769222.1 PREDICTED: leucine-rich repeat-containing protein 23-like [Octopus bimaculoides]
MSDTELQEVTEGDKASEKIHEGEVPEEKEKSEIIEEPGSTAEKVIEETEVKETEGKEESKVTVEIESTEEIERTEEGKIELDGLEDSTGVGDQNGKVKEDEAVEEVAKPVEEEEEILEEVPDNILSEEVVKEGISSLRRTGSGLAYSFIKLDLSNRKMTDISILEKYIHLRIVNVSNNYLTDLKPFNTLTDLLQLTADKNRIASIMLDPCPFLQYMSINNNRIKDISEGISHPLVRYIDLSNNKIKEVPPFDGSGFHHLTTLKIEGNRIQNINEFNIPNLKILHLGQNKITSTEWVLDLVNLEELKLNNNLIEKTHGFNSNMTKLKYIDLKENKIAQYYDLSQMSTLPQLNSLMLNENPISQDGDYRVEILSILKTLTVLDEEEFTDEDHAEVRDIAKQRHNSELVPNEGNPS